MDTSKCEKEPILHLQNFLQGSCPYIYVNFITGNNTLNCIKALALLDSTCENSRMSLGSIAKIYKHADLIKHMSLDFPNESVHFLLPLFLEDEKKVEHLFKHKIHIDHDLSGPTVILGNDFLCSKLFHSMTRKHIVMKNPQNSSLLVKIPIFRYSTNLKQ